jgi:hypothetical protein
MRQMFWLQHIKQVIHKTKQSMKRPVLCFKTSQSIINLYITYEFPIISFQYYKWTKIIPKNILNKLNMI